MHNQQNSRNSKEPLWHTADGRALHPNDMDDDHVENALALLNHMLPSAENAVEDATSYYPNFQGDMAQYYAEAEWDANISKASSKLRHIKYFITEFNNQLKVRARNRRQVQNQGGANLADTAKELRALANKLPHINGWAARKLLIKTANSLEKLIG